MSKNENSEMCLSVLSANFFQSLRFGLNERFIIHLFHFTSHLALAIFYPSSFIITRWRPSTMIPSSSLTRHLASSSTSSLRLQPAPAATASASAIKALARRAASTSSPPPSRLHQSSASSSSSSTGTQSFAPTSTVSTLSNRLRVVTEPNPGHFQAVGVYIDAGSRYETGRNSGVSHLIDRLAFKVSLSICVRASEGSSDIATATSNRGCVFHDPAGHFMLAMLVMPSDQDH